MMPLPLPGNTQRVAYQSSCGGMVPRQETGKGSESCDSDGAPRKQLFLLLSSKKVQSALRSVHLHQKLMGQEARFLSPAKLLKVVAELYVLKQRRVLWG
ncbi:unnamed protein product [Effrenium voratum]|nr:unnamed protein product [Effrenium voratum]